MSIWAETSEKLIKIVDDGRRLRTQMRASMTSIYHEPRRDKRTKQKNKKIKTKKWK